MRDDLVRLGWDDELERAWRELQRELQEGSAGPPGRVARLDRGWSTILLGADGPQTRVRNIGADVVGMSTVPEVIVGVHARLKIVGFSVITDMCLPDHLAPANLADIIATANDAEPRLRRLVQRLIEELP